MTLPLFNGAAPSPILAAIRRDCAPEQVVSVQFREDAPAVDENVQWRRLRWLLSCEPVDEALGSGPLPLEVPGTFHRSIQLETIGTLANFLIRGGVHQRFVDGYENAMRLSQIF